MIKRTPYITLGVGFVAGAVAMVTVLAPGVIPQAFADPATEKVRSIANLSATDMGTLKSLDSSFTALAEYIAPAVVHIKATNDTQASGMAVRSMGGQGSGVIFRPDGYILTNDHVVGGFDEVTVVLNDGREFAGKVTRAQDSDLAVVKVNATELPTVKFGDSNGVRAGQFAIAVGAPFGLENSVTIGHVSALQRQTYIPDSRLGDMRAYFDLIQTDAAINMGNSGGPLLNVDGEVIGINTAIYSETGGNNGIGFAIPSNQARLIADLLIEKGKISRAFLGVTPVNLKPYQKKDMNLNGGALLDTVENGTPADLGGLKKNDVITRIGSYPISTQIDLRNAMLRYSPGETVNVEYIRDGKTGKTSVKLGEPPKVAAAQPQPAPFDFEGRPFEDLDLEKLDPQLKKFFDEKGGRLMPPPAQERVPRQERNSDRARLGVVVESVTDNLRKQFSIPSASTGAVVTQIESGSVAEKLGLEQGDVIQKIGNQTIKSAEDLVNAMASIKVGDTSEVSFIRHADGAVISRTQTVKF